MTVILKFFPDAVFLNRRGGGLAEYPSGCRLFRKSRLSETRSHRGSGIRAGHAGDVPVLAAGGGWKASACEDISHEAGQGCFGGKPGEGDDGGRFPRFFVFMWSVAFSLFPVRRLSVCLSRRAAGAAGQEGP